MPTTSNPTPSTRIPRPPNAFICFRSHFVAQQKALCGPDRQQDWSKVAGERWRLLSDEERRPFFILAEQRRDEHMAAHPDYKYTPSPGKRARARASATALAASKARAHRRMAELSTRRPLRRAAEELLIDDRPSPVATPPPPSKRARRRAERHTALAPSVPPRSAAPSPSPSLRTCPRPLSPSLAFPSPDLVEDQWAISPSPDADTPSLDDTLDAFASPSRYHTPHATRSTRSSSADSGSYLATPPTPPSTFPAPTSSFSGAFHPHSPPRDASPFPFPRGAALLDAIAELETLHAAEGFIDWDGGSENGGAYTYTYPVKTRMEEPDFACYRSF
ncbi:Sox transcription factor 8 [Mycena kentingensis (nom. inval.)]|nr:Sox transcription factor 8 [Mycena kentingensis (nom. inval.)]